MPHVAHLTRSPRARLLVAGLTMAGLTTSGILTGEATAAPAPASGPEFEQACGGTSWWAGSTNVCDGAVVYRDYVNDDHGADTGDLGFNGTQNAFGTLAHPAGDKRYPMDKISSADLVRLELVRRGDNVDVVAELAALYQPDDTVLALAIDTDGDQTTGGGAWGDLGVRSAGWTRSWS